MSGVVHGARAIQGAREYMEDTHVVVSDLLGAAHPRYDFFGVYDGHGGAGVAQRCAERLHLRLRERLLQGDEVADALRSAFRLMDDDERHHADTVGSTAVVVVASPERMWIAHVGDSRALLCQDGQCVPLTHDHAPDRPDEQARIQQHGGMVVPQTHDDVARVMGSLAVSRAIGDHYLRAHGVIAVPDVVERPIGPDDEFMLLASDGLFSVMSNEAAVSLARRSVQRATARGVSIGSCARIAANVLLKIAAERSVQDNATAVVVMTGRVPPEVTRSAPSSASSHT